MVHQKSTVGKSAHTPKNGTNPVEIDPDRLAAAMTAALKILRPGTNTTVRVVKRVTVESHPPGEVSA